jgi:glycosyltransferase involved in cell wall biosynthesis
MLARTILHYMRQWDLRTANGVDHFIANSEFIARRIWKVYRREAKVIYPPVDVDAFSFFETKQDYYLAASRLVPYKKMDLIVEAFAGMPDKKLVVIGDGPDMAKVKAKASPNVEILGYQPFGKLKELMQGAAAFVFAAEEDFGITPVESQACGTPVIAFGKGGALETVRGLGQHAQPTGVFFPQQDVRSIQDAVKRFSTQRDAILPSQCRENAMQFSVAEFRARYSTFVRDCVENPAGSRASYSRAA